MTRLNFKVLLLFCIFCLLTSCSNDSNLESESDTSSLQKEELLGRNSGGVYDDYSNLLRQLYTNYSVESSREYENGDYLLTEVHQNNQLKGYFLENTRDQKVIYVFENKTEKRLFQYTFNGSGYDERVFNLASDANYNTNGFNPQTPSNVSFGARFWGWTKAEDLRWSECRPDGRQTATAVYYVLWSEAATEVRERSCTYVPTVSNSIN